MADKKEPEENAAAPSAQKVTEAFAPINATDRPSAVKNANKPVKKRRRFGLKKVILSIGFVVLVMIIGTFAFKTVTGGGEDSTSNEVKSVLSDDQMKEYQSPENNFTIKMPGFPSITKKEIQVGNLQIPQFIYQRTIDNGNKLYILEVLDYSKSPITDEKKELELRLNSRIQNLQGANLIKSQTGSYNGINALEANYKYNEKGKEYEARVRYLIKNNKVYTVVLVGGDQAAFDEYANSLRIN